MNPKVLPQQFDGNPIGITRIEFFPKPTHYKSVDGELYSQNLAKVVKKTEPGQASLNRSEFTDVSRTSLEAFFITDENLSKGRYESAHGVMFGQLLLSSREDQAKTAIVAVKPLEVDSVAIHEFAVSDYLNGFGKRSRPKLAFTPLGFWRDTDGTIMLLTEYEHGVQSYDGLFWKGDETDMSFERIEKAIARCVFGLGMIHNLGLVHRDTQVKNMATDNKGVRFIDLESSRGFSLKIDSSYNDSNVRQDIMSDLQMFSGSLISRLQRFENDSDDPEDLVGEITERIIFSIINKAHLYSTTVNLPTSRVPKDARLNEEETTRQLLSGMDATEYID